MIFLQINSTNVVIILLQLLMIALVFYAFFRLIKFCFVKVKDLLKSQGVSSLVSFLALGISATFFYRSFESFLTGISAFLADSVKIMSAFLAKPDAGNAAGLSGDELFATFTRNILNLPFLSILLFCVVWVFVAIVLQTFVKAEDQDKKPGISEVFSTHHWRYTVFGILIIFGIFLSIASIIAVPVFQEDQSQDSNSLGLQIRPELNNYLPDSTLFFHKYSIMQDSSEMQLSSIYAQGEIENWNDKVSTVYLMILQCRDGAIGRFNIAKEEKLTEDAKIDYMQELIEWFLVSKSILLNNLNDQRPEVNSWVSRQLQNKVASVADSTATQLSRSQSPQSLDFQKEEEIPKMPPLPDVSAGYGIFGWMAGWILMTNNLAFALIVGMIGFGVFGATISHIILETTDPGKPVQFNSIDYLKLLVRGFSAAIVIYLATKGGLLVVSGTEASLNAYIIFFLCFIASVFSEVVWNWVKEKLVNSLDKNKQG